MPGKAANASHANHYTCTSSRKYKQLPIPVQAPDTSQTDPYVVQVPNNLKVSLGRCWRPIVHRQILTLVQVPNNSSNSLPLCRFQQC
ncbi:hypothetical protein O181_052859 [Austropuccinia psidii MF-1]|uniref:Uncharacterized protein n=1 Tax=Austropuccinia psidii MF-1 TaxID=1389203 RepID=A0A9Q3HS42_9BASI|nr:hypothetical protein [Austropuccinia psidii MF-1]